MNTNPADINSKDTYKLLRARLNKFLFHVQRSNNKIHNKRVFPSN
jgi:hypothetical protein